MVPPPDDEHDCGWKAYAQAQAEKLTELTDKLNTVTAKLEALEKLSKGHRSERRKRKKMPPPIAPLSDPEETANKRRAAEELRRTKLETEIVPVPVPAEDCKCPKCGGDKELKSAGSKAVDCLRVCRRSFQETHLQARDALSGCHQTEPHIGLDSGVELLGQQQATGHPTLVATEARSDGALGQRVRAVQRPHEPGLLQRGQSAPAVKLEQEHLGLQSIDISYPHPKLCPPQLSRDVQPLETVEHLEQPVLGERDQWLELPVATQRPLELAEGIGLAQAQLIEGILGQLGQRR